MWWGFRTVVHGPYEICIVPDSNRPLNNVRFWPIFTRDPQAIMHQIGFPPLFLFLVEITEGYVATKASFKYCFTQSTGCRTAGRGVCMMSSSWRDQQDPSLVNYIAAFLAANSYRLNFLSISPVSICKSRLVNDFGGVFVFPDQASCTTPGLHLQQWGVICCFYLWDKLGLWECSCGF
jgi:hypothetical protein